MKLAKWVVILLCLLALFQFFFWGTEDCDACSFDVNDFYSEYKAECLTNTAILPEVNYTIQQDGNSSAIPLLPVR